MPNTVASIAALSFTNRDKKATSVRYEILPVRAQLTTSYTKIFTNDLGSGRCILDVLRVCNRTAVDTTFSFCVATPAQTSPWNTAADAIADFVDVPVEAKETLTAITREDPLYLDPSDEIWMKAADADSINVSISMRVEQ